MRRFAGALAMALALLGCSATPTQPANRFALQIWQAGNEIGCVLMGVQGALVADPVLGPTLGSGPNRMPIRWPSGFSGVRVGAEIQVLNRSGAVVAMTGKSYEIFYTEVGFTAGPGEVIDACGEVRPL